MQKSFVCSVVAWLLTGLLVAAEPGKPLTGQVLNENGQPLAGAKVMVTGGDEDSVLASIVTGADGRFSFDGRMRTERAMLVATKEGKCLDWDDSFRTNAAEPVLRLGPAAAIEGVIVDDAEKPVAGTSVRASLRLETPTERDIHYRSAGGTLTVKTDAQGKFYFANVPPAALVQFDMSAPGYAWSCAIGPFAPGQKGLRFVLPPEGRLEGTVVEKGTGRPLADLCLALLGAATGEPHCVETKTDKDGRFRMAGLGEDSYDIEIVGANLPEAVVIGKHAFVGQALPEWIGSQQEIHVEVGKVTSPIKIEAIKGGTAELILTDRDTGKPITSSAVLYVSPTAERRTRHFGMAMKDGVAKLYLAPGEHVVTEVMAPGYYCPQRNTPFLVEAGKTNRVTVSVRAIPRVTGIVRDPAGKPVAGASVRVLPFAGGCKDLVADDKGRFSIDPADQTVPGFHILVRDPHRPLAVTGLVEVYDLPPEEQQLAAKGFPILHADRGDVTLRTPIMVSGVVRGSQGQPVAGATVRAKIVVGGEHQSGGLSDVVATAQTDKEGKYQIALGGVLIMGNYAISAMAPGYGTAGTQVVPADLGSEAMAPNRPDGIGPAAKVEKNFVLNPADRVVQGVVKDRQGLLLPGAVVMAHPAGYQAFPLCAVTDAKGRFSLEHVVNVGTIYLFAHVPGRHWIGRSTVRPGKAEAVIEVGPASWD